MPGIRRSAAPAALVLALFAPPLSAQPEMVVHFLDVGQRDATLVESLNLKSDNDYDPSLFAHLPEVHAA